MASSNFHGHPCGVLAAVALMLLASGSPLSTKAGEVYVSGEGPYAAYRIPALIVAADGSLLAFAEGRKGGFGDSGDIDLVLRRSADDGATWGKLQVIADDGANTMGNPCPVVERESGRILLPLTRNLGGDSESEILAGTSEQSRQVWIMHSDDHGKSWSEPREITREVKRPEWTWYATGPGNGIQLQSGRLLIPCDHAAAGTKLYGSHAILSDDGGATWRIGGVISDRVNECQAAELFDGRAMLNMRSYHGLNRRAVAVSANGGESWEPLSHDDALIEPVCQASLISAHSAEGRVLVFSNPASAKRERMTIRISGDGGKTWPAAKVIHEGPAAYSSLADLGGGEIGCLYECGEKGAYERIVFQRLATAQIGSQ